jgi:cytochrome c-type biogenesis protein CcmH/NrfG
MTTIPYYPGGFSGGVVFGPYAYAPPLFPGPVMPVFEPVVPALAFPNFPVPMANPARPPRPARAPDANRAKELMTLGDRLFRAGNLIRAVERYEQSIRADPNEADPIVRLAQVALVRGKYAEAALRLREAQNAEPNWLATAADVKALFPEPADFARQVAKLETHLQARPDDRDGWLVLGALWYLSGRTRKAADVFLRLSDRRPDATLKAFLAATNAEVGGE